MAKQTKKLIANNKKAYHDYFIEDKYEAGISLAGTEVKSLRMGRISWKYEEIPGEKERINGEAKRWTVIFLKSFWMSVAV